MTDGRGDHPSKTPLPFPAPPPPAGPLRVLGTSPPGPTAPDAEALPHVARPVPPPPPRAQVLVTLIDSAPLVWRRLAVPRTITLVKLHRVPQTALGWTDSHLHQFVVSDAIDGDPELLVDEPPAASTRRTTLAQVALGVGTAFRYHTSSSVG